MWSMVSRSRTRSKFRRSTGSGWWVEHWPWCSHSGPMPGAKRPSRRSRRLNQLPHRRADGGEAVTAKRTAGKSRTVHGLPWGIKLAVFAASVISLSWFFAGWRQIHEASTLASWSLLVGGTLATLLLLGVQGYWIYFEE